MRRKLTISAGLAAAVLAASLLFGASSAAAKAPVNEFKMEPSTTQAGGHPDMVTTVLVGTRNSQAPYPPCACNDPKEIQIHAPPGVVANPHVLSTCSAAEFAITACPPDSQVGFTVIQLSGSTNYNVLPIFRATTPPGVAALFEFKPPELPLPVPQYLEVSARTGTDYGLDIVGAGFAQIIPPEYIATVFWGTPALPEHDFIRFKPKETLVFCNRPPLEPLVEGILPSEYCSVFYASGGQSLKEPVPASLPARPFMQNPTACLGPLTASIDTLAYDNETDHASTIWPATTGCSLLSFDPSLSATPTTSETDSPAGLDTKLVVPQFSDPNTPSPSEIRATTVTLPEGFSINPSAADGKTFCTDEEASFGSTEPSHCPEFAKIGTDVLDSSALPAPIPGYIYIGKPLPGNRYRIILTAGGFGTFVKIAGSIHPDPQTGQLVVSFQDLPQAPFQEFDLHFFGSERGLLATPTKCGTYPVETTFTPWDDLLSNQNSTQFFVLDSGPAGAPCPAQKRPFNPGFEAGTEDNTAGMHTPLSLRLSRADGDQNIVGLDVKAPPGFTATLKGVPYCPQSALDQLSAPGYSGIAEQASPACPAASRIGSAVAGAGAGTRPVHVYGSVYLAGPYKGAPLSLVAVVPAVSGPYDLGTIAVRAALFVDPETAQVTAISDPLPQIFEGIPLRTRSVQINLDRPGFTLNPTNCDPFSIDATVRGNEGGAASPTAPFAVANCADLAYKPKLSLKLSGGLGRRGHPAIRATFTAKPGEANTRKVTVALPEGELLDNAHIGTVCTRVQFAADTCPGASKLGSAEVTTPLLDGPLAGDVYLRSSDHKLPDLVVDLKGQVDVVLVGRIDTTKSGSLRTSFETAPDVPFGSFKLNLAGGAKGLLVNSRGLCGEPQKAKTTMTGQNGAVVKAKTKLKVSCGAARHKRSPRAGSGTGAVR